MDSCVCCCYCCWLHTHVRRIIIIILYGSCIHVYLFVYMCVCLGVCFVLFLFCVPLEKHQQQLNINKKTNKKTERNETTKANQESPLFQTSRAAAVGTKA